MAGRSTSVNRAARTILHRIPTVTTSTSSGRTYRRRRGKEPACADTVSAAPTSPPGGVCRSKCDYLCEIYVRTAGTLYGRIGWASMEPYGTCHGPDGLQVRHRAAGPSGRRTDDADTHGWTSRPRAPGACSRSEPTAACPGHGLGSLESTHRWTEQHGLRHCTEWGRRTYPGWSR